MAKIKQFYYDNTAPTLNTNILQNGEYVISLNIHALPGTSFSINNSGTIVMNATGNFGMNCEDFPIQDLKITNIITNSDKTLSYPIVIDILYL